MKKSKINPLFFFIIIPVFSMTPILTSCTVGKVNEFCNEIKIRDLIPNPDTYYPVYASPKNEPSRMSPNYLGMWDKEGLFYKVIWVDKETGWFDNLIEDDGTIDSEFTWQHLFLNTNVCKAFEVNPTEPIGDLNNLYSKLNRTEWNLSGCYINDEYADETVKALNNPWFYRVIDGTNSIASQIENIDLSSNNIWYVPFFGYCSAPIYSWIYGGEKSDSTNQKYIGFRSLINLNLKNNQITTLPHEKISGSTDKNDITKFSTTNPNFSVYVDNNYMAYNFSSTLFLSGNYQFSNESVIKYTLDSKNNTIESYAIYQGDKYIRNYLNHAVRGILGASIRPQSIPLDSYIETLDKNVDNLSNANKNKVGSCYAQIIINYFNNDNLFSSYIYSELSGLPEIIFTLIEGTDYGFCYPEYSVNKGSIKLSFDLGDPRIVKKTTSGEYNILYPFTDTQSFIATHIDKYCISGWTSTFMIIVLTIIGIVGISLLVYFLYFKRYLTNKKHKQEMLQIKKVEHELMEKNK